MCPGCGNHNYAGRHQCNRCQLPPESMRGGGGARRGGEWRVAGLGGPAAGWREEDSGGTPPLHSAAIQGRAAACRQTCR